MKLSYNDEKMLSLGLRENGRYDLACAWYLKGWTPQSFQYVWHQIPYKNTTNVWGIGAGKTTGVASSILMDCLTLPGFIGLNASVTAKQAELAFEMVDAWRDRNPRLERLITDTTLRPYPIIRFFNGSRFEFRTAGQAAKFIRGHEYDRINYDEAGLDPDGEAIRVLRGRLRGVRDDGRSRMARLDCTGTVSPAVWFQERFEKGLRGSPLATDETLKDYFSMRVETYDNKALTEEQIHLMEAEYPPELIDIELRAIFPDWGLGLFPRDHINACTDASLNDEMYLAIDSGTGFRKPGYNIVEWPRVGIIEYEVPWTPDMICVQAGDPGTDIPPKRNSPCVMVIDVSKNPKRLVFFSWVRGHGSYQPFLDRYEYASKKYYPVAKGCDTTGTQKMIDELAFERMGLTIDPISFSNMKDGMLNTLSLDITGHNISYPNIPGLVNQLSIYTREGDKIDGIAQDLVMTLAQCAYLARLIRPDDHKGNKRKAAPAHRDRKQRAMSDSRAGRRRR